MKTKIFTKFKWFSQLSLLLCLCCFAICIRLRRLSLSLSFNTNPTSDCSTLSLRCHTATEIHSSILRKWQTFSVQQTTFKCAIPATAIIYAFMAEDEKRGNFTHTNRHTEADLNTNVSISIHLLTSRRAIDPTQNEWINSFVGRLALARTNCRNFFKWPNITIFVLE